MGVETKFTQAQLKGRRINNISQYEEVYSLWQNRCGIEDTIPSLKNFLIGPKGEFNELRDAVTIHLNEQTPFSSGEVVSEAFDILNLCVSLFSKNNTNVNKALSNGRQIDTFDDLQKHSIDIASQLGIKNLENAYKKIEQDIQGLENLQYEDLVEATSKLLIDSTIIISVLGYELTSVVAAKFQRNYIKYNPANFKQQEFKAYQKKIRKEWPGLEADEQFIKANIKPITFSLFGLANFDTRELKIACMRSLNNDGNLFAEHYAETTPASLTSPPQNL